MMALRLYLVSLLAGLPLLAQTQPIDENKKKPDVSIQERARALNSATQKQWTSFRLPTKPVFSPKCLLMSLAIQSGLSFSAQQNGNEPENPDLSPSPRIEAAGSFTWP